MEQRPAPDYLYVNIYRQTAPNNNPIKQDQPENKIRQIHARGINPTPRTKPALIAKNNAIANVWSAAPLALANSSG